MGRKIYRAGAYLLGSFSMAIPFIVVAISGIGAKPTIWLLMGACQIAWLISITILTYSLDIENKELKKIIKKNQLV